jgi:ABC-2 type transport system ATP-binding protein
VARVAAEYPLVDLSVREPDIEAVIAKMYAEKHTEVPAEKHTEVPAGRHIEAPAGKHTEVPAEEAGEGRGVVRDAANS